MQHPGRRDPDPSPDSDASETGQARSPRVRAGLNLARSAAVAATVAGVASVAVDPLGVAWQSGIVGALLGAGIAANLWIWRRLAPRWGRATALAVICLAWGVALGTAAAAAPDCPGWIDATDPNAACTPAEIGNWALIGALQPVLFALIAVPAVLAVRASARGVARLAARSPRPAGRVLTVLARMLGWREPPPPVPATPVQSRAAARDRARKRRQR